eukprot:8064489-Lingulodinium_polyedra.AAC.1
MCAFVEDAVPETPGEWIKISVDTGAGSTAWPEEASYGVEHERDTDLKFRTATGEIVPAGCGYTVTGCD